MKALLSFVLGFLIVQMAFSQTFKDWSITVNGTNSEEGFVAISDMDGNVFMGGFSKSNDVDFDPGLSENILSDDSQNGGPFVAKYDAQGNHLWAFLLSVDVEGRVKDMVADPNGGIYVLMVFKGTINADPAGSVLLSSGSSSDALVVHYFDDGSFDFSFSINGEGQTEATSIALDNDGNIIIGGTQTNVSDFDPSGNTQNLVGDPSGPFLAKYSPIGEYIWAWVSPNDGLSFINDIVVDESNNILVAGSFSVSVDLDPFGTITVLLAEDDQDGFVAKYNSTGILAWSRHFKGQSNELAEGIEIMANGEILVVGPFDGDIDLDPGVGQEIITSTNSWNSYLVSLTDEGQYINGFTLSASGDCRVRSVHTDANNDIVICGSFNGSFSPGNNQDHISYGGRDLFCVKYDQAFSLLNSFVVGGYQDDFISLKNMSVSGSKVIITGSYDVNFDFAPGNLDDPAPTSAGLTDIFLAQYTFGTEVGIEGEDDRGSLFSVFPNPATEVVRWNRGTATGPYLIVDITGKIVARGNSTGTEQIDISPFPSGIYCLQFINTQHQALFVK